MCRLILEIVIFFFILLLALIIFVMTEITGHSACHIVEVMFDSGFNHIRWRSHLIRLCIWCLVLRITSLHAKWVK